MPALPSSQEGFFGRTARSASSLGKALLSPDSVDQAAWEISASVAGLANLVKLGASRFGLAGAAEIAGNLGIRAGAIAAGTASMPAAIAGIVFYPSSTAGPALDEWTPIPSLSDIRTSPALHKLAVDNPEIIRLAEAQAKLGEITRVTTPARLAGKTNLISSDVLEAEDKAFKEQQHLLVDLPSDIRSRLKQVMSGPLATVKEVGDVNSPGYARIDRYAGNRFAVIVSDPDALGETHALKGLSSAELGNFIARLRDDPVGTYQGVISANGHKQDFFGSAPAAEIPTDAKRVKCAVPDKASGQAYGRLKTDQDPAGVPSISNNHTDIQSLPITPSRRVSLALGH